MLAVLPGGWGGGHWSDLLVLPTESTPAGHIPSLLAGVRMTAMAASDDAGGQTVFSLPRRRCRSNLLTERTCSNSNGLAKAAVIVVLCCSFAATHALRERADDSAAAAPLVEPRAGDVLLTLAEQALRTASQAMEEGRQDDELMARIGKARNLAARAVTALEGTPEAARAARVAAHAARLAEQAGPPGKPAVLPHLPSDLPVHVTTLHGGAVPISSHVAAPPFRAADGRRWRHFASPFAEAWVQVGAGAEASDTADVQTAPSRFGIQTTPLLTAVARDPSLGVFATATQESAPPESTDANFFDEAAATPSQYSHAASRATPAPTGLPVAAALWYTSVALASLVHTAPGGVASGVAYVGVTSLADAREYGRGSGTRAFALELNDEPLLPLEYTAAMSDGPGWQTWPVGALRTAFFYLHGTTRTRGRIEFAGLMPCPGVGVDGFGDDAAPPVVLASFDSPPTSANHTDRSVWGEARYPGTDYDSVRRLTCVEEVTRKSARRRVVNGDVAEDVVIRVNVASCLRTRPRSSPEVLYIGVLNPCPLEGEFHVRLGGEGDDASVPVNDDRRDESRDVGFLASLGSSHTSGMSWKTGGWREWLSSFVVASVLALALSLSPRILSRFATIFV